MAGMVEAEGDFNNWLSKKLCSLNPDTDLEVFVSYITSILDTETTKEDQINCLSEILSELVENDPQFKTEKVCEEIFMKWSNSSLQRKEDVEHKNINLNTRMHDIIVHQTTESAKLKASQKSQQDCCKEAILAQYSNVSDGEETDEECDEGDGKKQSKKQNHCKQIASSSVPSNEIDLLTKNVNAILVKEREKQARDDAKRESENKKQKDKEDREKNKQKSAERKETEKKRTQKGEKRR